MPHCLRPSTRQRGEHLQARNKLHSRRGREGRGAAERVRRARLRLALWDERGISLRQSVQQPGLGLWQQRARAVARHDVDERKRGTRLGDRARDEGREDGAHDWPTHGGSESQTQTPDSRARRLCRG